MFNSSLVTNKIRDKMSCSWHFELLDLRRFELELTNESKRIESFTSSLSYLDRRFLLVALELVGRRDMYFAGFVARRYVRPEVIT